MRITWRDGVATVLVAIAVVLYVLWLAGIEVVGASSVKALGAVILGLGLVASVIAVVYGVGRWAGCPPRVYLAMASAIGLLALVAGVAVLVTANEVWLGTLVAATVVLWPMATVRHAMLAEEGAAEAAETSEQLRRAA